MVYFTMSIEEGESDTSNAFVKCLLCYMTQCSMHVKSKYVSSYMIKWPAKV